MMNADLIFVLAFVLNNFTPALTNDMMGGTGGTGGCRSQMPDPGLAGSYVPQCDSQGNYVPQQCQGSTGYCWCVSTDGTEIPNTRFPPYGQRKNCNNERTNYNNGGCTGSSCQGNQISGGCTGSSCPGNQIPGGCTGPSCQGNQNPGGCTGSSCTGNQQQCSKQNEVWSQCMPACEDTCTGKPADCGMGVSGCTPGCTCAPGYVRQGPSTTYDCIPRIQCPPTGTGNMCPGGNCPGNTCTGAGCQPTGSCSDPNAQFMTCGSGCPETCQGKPSMCSMNCVQGCFCKSGYVKQSNDPNSQCLLKSQCITTGPVTCTGNNCNTGNTCTGPSCFGNQQQCSKQNEVWSQCMPSCEDTCVGKPADCGMGGSGCTPGCTCAPGYVRQGPSTMYDCIPRSQCPPTNTGNICTGGNCPGNTCTGPSCPGTGVGTGSCSSQYEQYQTCGSACPETCQGNPQACTMQCVMGCFCVPGYVRQSSAPGASCVRRDQCNTGGNLPCTGSSCGIYPTPNNNNNYPTPNNNNACTAPNTEYSTCGTACGPTCGQRSSMCGYQCIQGCFCKPGYYKLTSATNAPCVLPNQCGSYVGRRRRFSRRRI